MGDANDPKAAALARVRRVVEAYVARGKYALYPDAAVVDNVIQGLADNLVAHGRMYCPCAHAGPEDPRAAGAAALVCPCPPHHADIARQGYCDCALFASHDFVRASFTNRDR